MKSKFGALYHLLGFWSIAYTIGLEMVQKKIN